MLYLVVMPAGFSVTRVLLQDLLPLPQHTLHSRVMRQPYLDVATHDHLSRIIKQDERQAGMADRSPREESLSLVQLDRHNLKSSRSSRRNTSRPSMRSSLTRYSVSRADDAESLTPQHHRPAPISDLQGDFRWCHQEAATRLTGHK